MRFQENDNDNNNHSTYFQFVLYSLDRKSSLHQDEDLHRFDLDHPRCIPQQLRWLEWEDHIINKEKTHTF